MIENIKISSQHEQVLQALLTHRTKREASRASGVSESTIYRLLRNPEFVQMLETARKQIFYNIIFNLGSLSQDSIKCLQDLIISPTSNNAVKCKASSFVIDKIVNIENYRNLERRVNRIENLLKIK